MGVYKTLRKINVNDHVEKKGKLSYLSWAWAWDTLMQNYPNSFATVYEDENGRNYFNDGKTAWVKTGVTVVDGDWIQEHIEYLPVMDNQNHSIPLDRITSFDVNKTIQRSLTKAIARHGLGMYIYAGEDLPEDEEAVEETAVEETAEEPAVICDECHKPIEGITGKNGDFIPVDNLLIMGKRKYNKKLCARCLKAADVKGKA